MGWTKTNDPLEPEGLEPLESALYGDRSQLLAEERAVLLGALLNSLVFPLPDSCMHLTARALWGHGVVDIHFPFLPWRVENV